MEEVLSSIKTFENNSNQWFNSIQTKTNNPILSALESYYLHFPHELKYKPERPIVHVDQKIYYFTSNGFRSMIEEKFKSYFDIKIEEDNENIILKCIEIRNSNPIKLVNYLYKVYGHIFVEERHFPNPFCPCKTYEDWGIPLPEINNKISFKKFTIDEEIDYKKKDDDHYHFKVIIPKNNT